MRTASSLVLALALGLGNVPGMCSEPPSELDMDRVCENWLRYIVNQTGSWAGESHPSISGIGELRSDGILLARVYSISPRGFVVVPVVRDLPPVKVYSDETDLEIDKTGEVAGLLRALLQDRLARYLDASGGSTAKPDRGAEPALRADHRRQWDRVLSGATHRSRLRGVGPLLTTAWHQSTPYNNLCPMGDGDRSAVGCFALAVAQILRYHEWPPAGTGLHWYLWDGDQSCGGDVGGGELSARFDDTYDWANMPDSCGSGCTPQENAAVAELCYEVGVALEIDYGTCGSAACVDLSFTALPNHFLYEPGIDREARNDHTTESWFEIIQSEIDADRPFVYLIPGHSIVCDGWREADGLMMVHMNYGWGGPQNLWYTLDDLPLSDPLSERMDRRIVPGNRRVLVCPDGLGDYPTIQAALDAAPSGFIIELEDGVFTGPENRNLDFRGKEMTLCSRSGAPELCVIDCENLGRGLVLHSGESLASAVRGITITNGLVSGPPPDDRGGAVHCRGVKTTFENCRIVGNHADGDGGGIYCDSASVVIAGCVVSANTSGGRGGGVCLDDSCSVTIVGCTVIGNTAQVSGGGLAAGASVEVTLSECALAGNSSLGGGRGLGGGGLACGPGASIEDCVIVGNLSSASGGGMLLECGGGSSPYVEGCTISGNRAEGTGGGIQLESSQSTWITYTILWDNCSAGMVDGLYMVGNPLVRFGGSNVDSSAVQGTGSVEWAWYNLHVPPGFCSPEDCLNAPSTEGDYRLKESSPCASEHTPTGLLVGALGVGCPPAVLTVRPDGAGDHPTIQAAVDAAGFYDVVELANGTYTGPGNRDVDFRGKELTVRSRAGRADSCVIDCQNLGRGFHFHTGESSRSVVEGLTVRGGRAGRGAAVLCGSASPVARGCIFCNNKADSAGGAVFCGGNANPSIENCTLVDNSAPLGGALHCRGSWPVLDGSILAFSGMGCAVACDSSGGASLGCCDLYGNALGDWIGCVAGQEAVAGNFSADPLFCDTLADDYHLHAASPCLDAPGCGRVGALGRGFYGNRAWRVPGEVATIQAGIDSAWAGDTVLVAAGIYPEHGIEMKSGVVLRSESGSAADVTVDAEGQGRVLTCIGVDGTAVIEALTFTGGVASGGWPDNAGGAIYCEDASPRVSRCVLHHNRAAYGGGMAAKGGAPEVEHCSFSGNGATACGGGVYSYYFSDLTMENCIIAHSTGGAAVACYYGSSVTLSCSDVYGNAAGDWTGCIENQSGIRGNLSQDPLFCDSGGADYRIAEESPCAPENSPSECGLIGALESGCGATAVADPELGVPRSLYLGPAVPNPFNPVTEIAYGIPRSGRSLRAVLNVYDACGRRVLCLVDAERGPGTYRVSWNGKNHEGVRVASGVYFYRLAWNGESETKRMVLLK